MEVGMCESTKIRTRPLGLDEVGYVRSKKVYHFCTKKNNDDDDLDRKEIQYFLLFLIHFVRTQIHYLPMSTLHSSCFEIVHTT